MFLEKLKRLHGEATDAPWDLQNTLPLSESTLTTVAHCGDWQIGVDSGIKGGNYRDGLISDDDGADAHLIAILRNHAADIIALVEGAGFLVDASAHDGDFPDCNECAAVRNVCAALSRLNAEEV